MTRRQWIALLLASFLGGAAGARLFAPPAALADAPRVLSANQLWIFDAAGKHRLQLATYPRGGERGQPLIGFTDAAGKLKLLFRSYGPKDAPVAVFKDDSGRDRMVIGLRAADHAPFIACYDAAGKETLIHGRR